MNLAAGALKSGFASSPIRKTVASGVLHVTVIEAKHDEVIVEEIVFREVGETRRNIFLVIARATICQLTKTARSRCPVVSLQP